MPPTLHDLQLLARIVTLSGARTIPLARLAAETGVHRSYLYRVIQRAYRFVGLEPPRQPDDDNYFPIEVVRLARAFSAATHELDVLVRYPRIATGRSLDILVAEFLLAAESRVSASALVVPARSEQAIEGLLTSEFDVALGHGTAFDRSYGVVKAAYPGRLDELDRETVVSWQAVIVSSHKAENCAAIDWEPGSFADLLARQVGLSSSERSIRVLTFTAALELARRGRSVRFAVPDFFLANFPIEDRQRLSSEAPQTPFEDRLVAVFRRRERLRLAWLLDSKLWSSVLGKEKR